MEEDNRELISDLCDMKRSPGFEFVSQKIQDKMHVLKSELENIDWRNMTPESIGNTYISIMSELDGLNYLFGILESYDIHG